MNPKSIASVVVFGLSWFLVFSASTQEALKPRKPETIIQELNLGPRMEFQQYTTPLLDSLDLAVS